MPIQYSSTIKELPKGIREIAVDITAPEIETCFQKALRRLSRELEIEGFRKGKVPPHLAEKYIKPDAIFDEAAHIAIQDTYPDVVKHHELEPIGKPEVEVTKIARGDAMGYKVRVAVLGDVKLPDWKAKVQVKRNAIVAGEEEMAKAIAYLQKSRAQFTAVNRTAQKGDFVEIDFTMRRDGVILEGGVSQKHPFTLGEGKFIPGFEDGIVGMAVGEEKTYPLAFPDDYHEKTLAGKPVEATVKLVTLMERKLPELNDAFAKSLGAFESYAALRTSIEDGIRREKEEHESHRVRMEAVENIAVKSVMDIPDALIDREIEKMFSDLESRLAPMGANVDAYLGHLKKTRQDLVKEWHDEAVRRVRIALTLRQIAKAERIEPVGEEVGEKMNELIKEFPSAVEAKKRYSEDSLREYAQQVLANEAVLKLVEQHCVIN